MKNMKFLLLLFMLLAVSGCGNDDDNPIRSLPGDDFVAPDRFTTTVAGNEVTTPVATSMSLDQELPDIERAIFVIPGAGRGIMGHFNDFSTMAAEEGVAQSTLIVGVQFLEDVDLGQYDLEDNIVYWGEAHEWSGGGDARGKVSGQLNGSVSSFDLLDAMIDQVIANSPNLETVIVTGNSAGGATTQHYSAATSKPEQYSGIDFGFIPSNMVTTLYFTAERVVDGTQDEFAVPSVAEIASCPGYNFYPFGMIDRYPYVAQYSEDEIRQRYANRNMVYFAGTADHSNYDQCQLSMMGEDNYARNVIYYNYLQHVYGQDITDNQVLVEIEGAAHVFIELYGTDEYRRAAFHWTPSQTFNPNG